MTSPPAESSSPPERTPAIRVGDPERAMADDRLRRAVADGVLTLEDYTARIDVVYAAKDETELAKALIDLPAAPVVGGRSAPVEWSIGLFGDIRRAGTYRVGRQTTAVMLFGDVEYDLRGAYVTEDELVIRAWSLFGDVDVVVPEGVEANLKGFSLFGDRVVELAPVPVRPGTPMVRVVAFSLFGDAAIRNEKATSKVQQWITRQLGRPDSGTQ